MCFIDRVPAQTSGSKYLSWYPGVRVGLQQFRPSGFGIDCQPANSTSGQQLPAEQSGGEYSLWSALLNGSSGQWRGNGSFFKVNSYLA